MFWERMGDPGDWWYRAGDFVKVDTESAVEVLSMNCGASPNTLTVDGTPTVAANDEVWFSSSGGIILDDSGACDTGVTNSQC